MRSHQTYWRIRPTPADVCRSMNALASAGLGLIPSDQVPKNGSGPVAEAALADSGAGSPSSPSSSARTPPRNDRRRMAYPHPETRRTASVTDDNDDAVVALRERARATKLANRGQPAPQRIG